LQSRQGSKHISSGEASLRNRRRGFNGGRQTFHGGKDGESSLLRTKRKEGALVRSKNPNAFQQKCNKGRFTQTKKNL